MPVFSHRDNHFFIEDIALNQIADDYGTPCFVYSKAALSQAYQD